MSAAGSERDDVMHFIGGNVKSTFKTRLAQRMLGEVQVANLTPTMVVVFGIAMSAVIFTSDNRFMLSAITTITSDFNTTGEFAGFKRL